MSPRTAAGEKGRGRRKLKVPFDSVVPGFKIDFIEVLEEAGRNPAGRDLIKIRCVCSKEKILARADVAFGSVRSCGCQGALPVLPGQRYGGWEVSESFQDQQRTKRKRRSKTWQKFWFCTCVVCGNQRWIREAELRAIPRRQSEGCSRCAGLTEKGAGALGKVFRSYKDGAEAREIPWSLSVSEFSECIQKECAYCGAPPDFTSHSRWVRITGIDRKDPSRGYLLDNIWPCCGVCNRFKYTMSLEEFDAWVVARAPTLVHRARVRKTAPVPAT